MSPPCSYEQRRPLDPTTTLRHKQNAIHAVQIWWRSVKGFRVGWGSKFTISHWLWWSPLQHSHYRVSVW